ncbi:MAG: VWA domain-containing protein [Bacteroidota bacterium]
MQWLNPFGHLAWIAVAAIILLLMHSAARSRRDRRRFGALGAIERLTDRIDKGRRRIRNLMLVIGAGALVMALAGPRFGDNPREVECRGLDLVVALDVSTSMLADDIAPSRLERAKYELVRAVEQLSGDRVGLVVFAGDAFVQMPLTTDRNAFRLFLDVASPDQMPTQGTDFQGMLQTVGRLFASDPVESDRTRVLLIVSDGESHGSAVDVAMHELRRNGTEIFSVGIGERTGSRIPSENEGDFWRDRSGAIVTTRLEDEALIRMSGPDRYFEIGRASSTFHEFLPGLDRLQRSTLDSVIYEDYHERYQWPLVVAIFLLLAERFVPERRPVTASKTNDY